MKQFFGAFFGSILGIIIAIGLVVIILIAAVRSSFNSAFKEDKELVSALKGNSVIRLVMNGEIADRERYNPFKEIGDLGPFAASEGLGLNTIIKKLKLAKKDNNIKGIFICIKNVNAGFATLHELREAITDFKSSGKFIYAYSENYSHKEYFLASAANKVYLNPQGSIDWRGLSMNLLFFKQTFEKLDIEMQVFRHGRYKSAVEPFLLDKMSDANRVQTEKFLNSIWGSMVNEISSARKISPEELNQLANNLSIKFPEDAVGKLIDAASYEDEVVNDIKRKIGLKETDKIKFVDFDKYEGKGEVKIIPDKIAVIYASGSIGSGEGNDEEIGSDRLAKAIREARLDEKVKAIVLRVNSPGGSALASDVIWREMLLSKAAKPTIVSMGDLAASGGYYISCAAERIFAQPNTITGSIGVFGVIPNVQKMLANKFGITTDTVNTNKYSDLGGLRPLSAQESDFVQASVEKVYAVFKQRVAEGRNMSEADVDSIGQGRVWSGADALSIKLVDEIGGLDDAIAYAVKRAKLKDYKILEMPKQKSPFDALLGKKENDFETRMLKSNMGDMYTYFRQIRDLMQLKGVQARLPYEILFD